MIEYQVVVTARAEAHIKSIDRWWRENRIDAPSLVVNEFAAALRRLQNTPHLGRPYSVAKPINVRRVLLGRCQYHIYYAIDESQKIIQILAVWHNSRGRGPQLH